MLIEYGKRCIFDGRIIFIGEEVNAKHLRVAGPIAELSDVHYVVSNDEPPPGWQDALRDIGLTWIA